MFTQNEEIVFTIVVSTGLLVLFALIVILAAVAYKRRQRKHLVEMQRLRVEHENEVLKAEIKTINNLYWEIHGNIGPLMALTKTNLTVLAEGVDHSQKEEIEQIKSLIGEAIDDIRSLTRSVNTEYIKRQTLEELIQFELDNKRRRGHLTCELHVTGPEPSLDEEQKVGIYRILQEVFNNILKHADASKITVDLTTHATNSSLIITDDGCGFEMGGAQKGDGTGLISIQSRARQMGCTLQIESAVNEGTRVAIDLPLQIE